MASTLCNVILTAIIFASTQSWSLGLSPEEYSTRSPLGKIIDGLDIQQQLLLSELKKNNLDQEVRDVVKSLIQLQVFHEDQPYDESLGLIMAAILKDSCVWLKGREIVDTNSNCTISELRILLAKIDLYQANTKLYYNPIFNVRGARMSTCSCAWAKNELLGNDCSTSLHASLTNVDTISRQCSPLNGEGTICDRVRPGSICIFEPDQ